MSTRLQLSPHFTIEEFDCKDGIHVPPASIEPVRFLCTSVLEPLRNAFGIVTIQSGYRTPHENGLVGGAIDSQHLYDLHPATPAADLTCHTGTPRQWYDWLTQRIHAGGIGWYVSHVHVDLRAMQARW